MLILGLNTCFHGDASAAMIQDGEVVFAIAEERLNRVKHYGGVPALSIKACLDAVEGGHRRLVLKKDSLQNIEEPTAQ